VTIETAPSGTYSFNLQAQNTAGTGLPGTNTYGPVTIKRFINISSMAVDSNNNVYVADSGANKIHKIAPDGTITQIECSFPLAMVVDSNDNLYVGNGTNGVSKIAANGTAIGTTISGTHLNNSIVMAVDSNDNLYVAAEYRDSVWKIAANGTAVEKEYPIPAGVAISPSAIVVDSNNILCIVYPGYNSSNSGVLKIPINASVGTVIKNLLSPKKIAVDSNNNLYVATYNTVMTSSNGVYKIEANTYVIGPKITSGLTQPRQVAVDSNNNVYVTDSINNSVNIIANGNTNIGTIISGFNQPGPIVIDKFNNIYVASLTNGEVYKVAANGTAVGTTFY